MDMGHHQEEGAGGMAVRRAVVVTALRRVSGVGMVHRHPVVAVDGLFRQAIGELPGLTTEDHHQQVHTGPGRSHMMPGSHHQVRRPRLDMSADRPRMCRLEDTMLTTPTTATAFPGQSRHHRSQESTMAFPPRPWRWMRRVATVAWDDMESGIAIPMLRVC